MQTMDTKKLTLLSVCINHSRQEFELKVEILLSPLAKVHPRREPKYIKMTTVSCVQFAFFIVISNIIFILNLMVD